MFGSVLASIRTPLSSPRLGARPALVRSSSIFLNKARSIDAVVSLVTMMLLTLLITRTRIGKSLRAAADNPTAATYMGIDVDRAHRIAFALGIGITAIAGGLLATNYPFHPFVGLEYVIIMYAGVVLGGMGSIIGAFWGGMTIGLVQQMSTPGAADAAAERRDLRGVPADHLLASAGFLRTRWSRGHEPMSALRSIVADR